MSALKIEGPIEKELAQLVIEVETVDALWELLRERTENSIQAERAKKLLLEAGVPEGTLEEMTKSLLQELSKYKK